MRCVCVLKIDACVFFQHEKAEGGVHKAHRAHFNVAQGRASSPAILMKHPGNL
jgi:hypothetical protein